MSGLNGISVDEGAQSVPEDLPKGRTVTILEVVERTAGAFNSVSFRAWLQSELVAGKVVATYALNGQKERRVELLIPDHLELSKFSRDGILRHLSDPAWRQLGEPDLYNEKHA